MGLNVMHSRQMFYCRALIASGAALRVLIFRLKGKTTLEAILKLTWTQYSTFSLSCKVSYMRFAEVESSQPSSKPTATFHISFAFAIHILL
jgi:hypothetical protein